MNGVVLFIDAQRAAAPLAFRAISHQGSREVVAMPVATDTSVVDERAPGILSAAVRPERSGDPEWHTLRLFGRGRHPRGFDAGAETRTEL
jgi:hypothetical protein